MKTRIIGAIIALVLAIGGAFLLVTYVRGADARAAEGAELSEVYVVDTLVPEGTRGEAIAEFIKQDSIPARNVNEDAVTDLADLEGLVADADLLPGEQLVAARFIDPVVRASQGEVDVPVGMQEMSFALPVQRMVGGEIRPGSTIGIVVTKYEVGVDIEDNSPAFVPESQISFNRVLVTATRIGENVSSESESDEDPESGDTILLTVALATHDAERLAWAMEGYEQPADYIPYVGVWVTLQNEATDTSGSSPVNESNFRQ